MLLLIYIEPTSYLIPLWREIKARTHGSARIVFLEENLTQSWDIDLQKSPDMELLKGSRSTKFLRLLQLIGRRDVELVHLAGWGRPLLLVAMAAAWIRHIPVVMETDTPLPVGLPLWKRAVKRLLYPLLFKLPSRFMPGGSRQTAYLQHYGVARERITMARMTVDVTAISRYVDETAGAQRAKIRQHLGIPDETTVFLYVGRMEPHKGLQELVEAFGSLSTVGVESAALMLVGEGSMRGMLEKTAAVDSRILLTGRLSGTALLDAYAAADVFVLASRFEPWGLVVNEAMAAGLPVIATDRVGCVDDLVVEGKTGRVVPAESVSALAAAMESLLRDRPLRGKMTRNARDLIAGWTLGNEAEIVVNTWKCLLEH